MAVSQRLSENKHLVYRDPQPIIALEEFLCRVACSVAALEPGAVASGKPPPMEAENVIAFDPSAASEGFPRPGPPQTVPRSGEPRFASHHVASSHSQRRGAPAAPEMSTVSQSLSTGTRHVFQREGA
jgi:hypothetical protein